jgi:hypothetical protein
MPIVGNPPAAPSSSIQSVAVVQVFDYIYAGNTPLQGVPVSVTLNYSQANYTAPLVAQVPFNAATTTDANGYWTVSVPANNLITPLNTLYTVAYAAETGYKPFLINVSSIGVPAGGWQASNIIVSGPANLVPAGQTTGPLTASSLIVTGSTSLQGSAAITGLTTGQVLFPTAGGVISGSANLFWDNVNTRLGVGTNAPATLLDVNGVSTLRGAATITTGGLTINTGGLTVSGGGATITGNSTVTGTLTSTSTLTVNAGGFAVTGNSTNTGGLTVTGQLNVQQAIVNTGNSIVMGIGGTPLTLTSNQVSSQTLTFPPIREAEFVAIRPQMVTAAPANPAATNSLTFVMMGLGSSLAIAPQVTGRVWFQISGVIQNNTASDAADVEITYGTGAAPGNGVAITGTVVAGFVRAGNTANSAAMNFPFCIVGIGTGLTLGTTYWFDAALRAVTGGTATISALNATAFEL